MGVILIKIFKRPPLPCFSDKPPALPWIKAGIFSCEEITKLDEKQLRESRKEYSFWIFLQAKKSWPKGGLLSSPFPMSSTHASTATLRRAVISSQRVNHRWSYGKPISPLITESNNKYRPTYSSYAFYWIYMFTFYANPHTRVSTKNQFHLPTKHSKSE